MQNLVFIPGLLCNGLLFKHQIAAFAGRVNVHIADHTKFDTMADLAKDVLKKAPQKFCLIGLSMGGYLSLEVMRQAPKRVEKLCLVNTSARQDTPDRIKKRKALITQSQKGRFTGVSDKLIPSLIHPKNLNNKEITDTITEMALATGRDVFIKQQTAIIHRIDSRPYLENIQCPTTIIIGRQDEATPLELSQEMNRLIPNSKLSVIENCGHLSTLEESEQVNDIFKCWLEM